MCHTLRINVVIACFIQAELFETTRIPLLAHTGDTTIEGVLVRACAVNSLGVFMW